MVIFMPGSLDYKLQDRLDVAKKSLSNALDKTMPAKSLSPSVGLILGSGLGSVVESLETKARVSYDEVEGLVSSTAPGHNGSFLFADWQNTSLMVCLGRVHLYEGYSARDVVMPVYLMAAMGVKTLIITNAAGGLNPAYEPGDVVMIRDHINMTGVNPLIGVDAPDIGVRFPDMSQAYHQDLRGLVKNHGPHELEEGVYVGVTGPSLETSAERRFYHQCGGDMIGMSTVMEVIAASHCSLGVIGLSVITNKATGGEDQQPDTLEQVLENAKIGGEKIAELLQKIMPVLA